MASKPTKLSTNELNALEKNILNKSDDSIGNYLYNGYRIQVSKYNQSSTDRIRAFAKRRREQGLCVACGAKVKRINPRTTRPYKYCDLHHELALKSRKKKVKK
jgi:hypothetical protein